MGRICSTEQIRSRRWRRSCHLQCRPRDHDLGRWWRSIGDRLGGRLTEGRASGRARGAEGSSRHGVEGRGPGHHGGFPLEGPGGGSGCGRGGQVSEEACCGQGMHGEHFLVAGTDRRRCRCRCRCRCRRGEKVASNRDRRCEWRSGHLRGGHRRRHKHRRRHRHRHRHRHSFGHVALSSLARTARLEVAVVHQLEVAHGLEALRHLVGG